MKIRSGIFLNFGSFERLEFTYSDMGLVLISGPTGTGKSTVMDAVSWCLFGETSKEGAVDDVKRWGSDAQTSGRLEVDAQGRTIEILRIRGKGKSNDLSFIDGGQVRRGKDMVETQSLIEQVLGCTAELFFAASYFTQFSSADKFFIASAKDRRSVLEKVADLRLPITISEVVAGRKKDARGILDSRRNTLERLRGRVDEQRRSLNQLDDAHEKWNTSHASRLDNLRRDAAEFEEKTKAQIEEIEKKIKEIGEIDTTACTGRLEICRGRLIEIEKLRPEHKKVQAAVAKLDAEIDGRRRERKRFAVPGPEICPHCLGPTNNGNKAAHLEKLDCEISDLSAVRMEEASKLEALDSRLAGAVAINKEILTIQKEIAAAEKKIKEKSLLQMDLLAIPRFNLYLQQEEALRKEVNPHAGELKKARARLKESEKELTEAAASVNFAEHELLSLEQVYDFANVLRGKLLEKSVSELEGATNAVLEKYFDNEIRVSFSVEGDKVEAKIHKSGYEANYRQLSGGQRCLLKLAFGKALMDAAANRAGIHFDTLFFDEALHGLSPDLQAKAFGLFQELAAEHSSVFIIEHATEFGQLIDRHFKVTSVADISEIHEQS